MARPTKYRKEFAEQAYRLCILGLTDAQMAEVFGCSEKTLNTWKQAHPVFLQSITRGKVVADSVVAEALYKRATGYEHDDVDVRAVDGKIVQTRILRRYPPDTQAASLWLRNRQPELWRDKQSLEHSGPGGGPVKQQLDITAQLVSPAKRD